TFTCPWGGSCSSSSPSMLMRTPAYRSSAGIRSFAERRVHGLAVALADERHRHLGARAVLAHGDGDVVGALDLVVTDLDDDVALLDPGLVGRRPLRHIRDDRTCV